MFDPHQFITNPLGVVQHAFQKTISDPNYVVKPLNSDLGEKELFNSFLQNGGLEKVPLLDLKSFRWPQSGMLVRFRGMIQDMPKCEFYLGVFRDGDVWKTNKYMDIVHNYSDQVNDIQGWKRQLINCIPVPGQSDWAEPSGPCLNLKTSGDKKRQRDEHAATDDTVMEDANELDLSCQSEEFPCPKKVREGDTATSSSSLQGVPAESISNMPVVPSQVDIESLSCLVKVYEYPPNGLKLNDVAEFVGILAYDLPPGKVPRLHCVVYQKLFPSDFLPGPVSLEASPQLVRPIRDTLLAHLTTLLGNDGVAAQFMLLHLLSSVRKRRNTDAVRKLALNFTYLTNECRSVFEDRILSIFKNLLPLTHDLPLTLEVLNAGRLVSVKDIESKRLVPGALQLANGTHMTIEETPLDCLSLNSTGKDNAMLLRILLEGQKGDYDSMPVDVHLLILSEGNSIILPGELVLPFRPSSSEGPGTPNANTLAAWRWYLATMGSLPYSVDPDLRTVLRDEVEAASVIDPSLGTRDSWRLLTTMARLLCVSFGETSLLMEHWEMVKKLESLRKERL